MVSEEDAADAAADVESGSSLPGEAAMTPEWMTPEWMTPPEEVTITPVDVTTASSLMASQMAFTSSMSSAVVAEMMLGGMKLEIPPPDVLPDVPPEMLPETPTPPMFGTPAIPE